MKKVVILALCLLLVFMMAMPCFATDGEVVEEYAVGHAGGQVEACQSGETAEEYDVGHAEGYVEATYGQSGADNGISTGAVIGIVALVVVACAVVLYLKKKRC